MFVFFLLHATIYVAKQKAAGNGDVGEKQEVTEQQTETVQVPPTFLVQHLCSGESKHKCSTAHVHNHRSKFIFAFLIALFACRNNFVF